MALILSVLLGIAAFVLWDSDGLATGLCIAGILVLLFFHAQFKADAKAYVNRRDYWADGGPDR